MPQPSDTSNNELNMSDLIGEHPPTPPQATPISDIPEPSADQMPTPGTSTHPTQSGPTPFRNPHAAGHTAHIGEFGAPVGVPPHALPASEPDVLTKFRPNLAPDFDTFIAHGVVPPEDEPTTFLGKIARKLHLKTILSHKNIKYAGIGIASFAIFLFVFNFQTLSAQLGYWLNPPKPQAPIAQSLPATEVAVTAAEQPEAVTGGDVIIIPKLNLANVPVIFETSVAEASIQKSLQSGVVHYAGTALPGERSNAVIVGHSSNDWWEPGNYKFVFALLEKMAVGDQIQINYKQKKYVYEVTGSKVVEPTEISVLQPTSEPQLTLITCTPPGTSWKRLVVTAKQIQPLPSVPKIATATTTPAADQELALPGSAPGFFEQLKRWLGLASESNSK